MVLRQEFLCPTFTPIIKEVCLRDDFNFASYLSKCLYKTINNVLGFSVFSLLAFLCFIGLYIGIRMAVPADTKNGQDGNERLEIYIMGGIAVWFFIQDTIIKLKLRSIHDKLIRSIKTPYEFTISPFDAIRNPNYEKVIVPKYLKRPERMKVSNIRIINCHQNLFWLSSPVFMMKLMHFSLFLQLLWPI